jgi:large subunit ribosomal protein L27e
VQVTKQCVTTLHLLNLLQVTKRTSAKVQARRSSVKTFTKVVNYNHIMPTRYTLDIDLKGVVTAEALENSSKRTDANKVRAGQSALLEQCLVLSC